MHLVLQEPEIEGVSILYSVERLVAHVKTRYQDAVVADTSAYGRMLFLDGLVQSAEADEALYHEALIHPALVLHGSPRRVLVGGTGEGASLREILRHASVEKIVSVDLDAEVVELSRRFLEKWHAGSLDDPRVELRTEDIFDTLRQAAPGSFDAIVLDVTDPTDEGPSAALFSTRFFALVRRALADDGICVLQAGELDPLDLKLARTVRSTLEAVFPHVRFAHGFVPSFHCLWGFALMSRRPLDADPPDLARRIAALGELQWYTPTAHRAALELPPILRRRLAEPGQVITGEGELLSYTTGHKGHGD
ncbi:methyltransferase domain-containing protein [Nannocystis pusilla]|uniref:Polyamine aminopropyltransferase n=1 Tax=Nannocystis pusilla TaxID=889268 RepID=A0ABS7U1L4_9BACT|nr:methyltransferase domain-containing protein [Nannocystis pusilla]MBZ5714321.1 methyltransferase domain-containing protein [Nannocystis pusilla]